jgi:two-component system, NtrC family, response regulator
MHTRHRLLILADRAEIRAELQPLFADLELQCEPLTTHTEALLRRFDPEVVLLDCTSTEALRQLPEIIRLAPNTKVVAMVGQGDRELAVRAVGLGADDFYYQPIDVTVLSLVVRRALRMRELEFENLRWREQTGIMALEGILGVSQSMRAVCRAIEKVAPTNATVLILGESGTGKELLARALHRLSSRADKSFVAINCAAIPDNLLESELFGYEKGAFTGAVKRTLGKLELAQGGTVFLDEIGEMPAALQAKLLRVLQERMVERIGGHTPIALDLRIVCATHRDLDHCIVNNKFREDLYYRISEVAIRIPPLRERQGDSLLLAQALLAQASTTFGKAPRGFTPDAERAIQAHSWPGNVRELENRIKGAVIMTEGALVGAADLGLRLADDNPEYLNLRMARQRAEIQAITQALAVAKGNLSRAAHLLGITRPTLYDLLKKRQIDTAQFGASADL